MTEQAPGDEETEEAMIEQIPGDEEEEEDMDEQAADDKDNKESSDDENEDDIRKRGHTPPLRSFLSRISYGPATEVDDDGTPFSSVLVAKLMGVLHSDSQQQDSFT